MPAYDYSQPIVINTYNTPTSDATAEGVPQVTSAQPPSTDEDAGYEYFDKALSEFKRGDYRTALRLDEQAVSRTPDDPVIHEFGALCLLPSASTNERLRCSTRCWPWRPAWTGQR